MIACSVELVYDDLGGQLVSSAVVNEPPSGCTYYK